MSSPVALALALVFAFLTVPAMAAPASAVTPVGTTTAITSIDPPSPGLVNQTVTMKVTVTADDASTPVGTVYWDDAGACQSSVESSPVGADGTVTMTHQFTQAYDTYSMNACFFPTDSDAYLSSSDFGPVYDVNPIQTTTTITSIDPPSRAKVNQTVTMKVTVTAEDGSTPVGTVYWDDAGACQSSVTSSAVGADGTVTMTHAFDTAYESYSMNACFFPTDYDVYQSSEDFGPFYPVGPVATTTAITSIDPPSPGRVNQTVTMKVKVTAEDGSTPVGTVYWDDAGACQSSVTSSPVGADGTVTMTYQFPKAYDTYSMNACFFPTDYDAYLSSEEFGPTYDANPIQTTTTITSIDPPSGAVVGQTVTMKAKVTSEDGSVPVGTVHWDDAGACGTSVDSSPVGADGTVTLTHVFDTAYASYSMNACFFPDDYDVYQSSEKFGPFYPVTNEPPASAPKVTTHPVSRTVVVGQPATFTAAATGYPAPAVRWQRSTNGGNSWQNVSGATTTSLPVTSSAALNGAIYRAVFSNASGTAWSRPAALFVTQSFRGYGSPASNARIKRGSTTPVSFQLGDRFGNLLSDSVASNVPAAVQLWSARPGIYASAPCAYNSTSNLFRCNLKLPSALGAGSYYVAALTHLGSGPWVLADAVGSAHNPQSLQVIR